MNRSWQHFRTMPFGQYKGWQIEDLPDGYLAWLTTIDLRGWLHDAVHQEYDRRSNAYNSRERPAPPPAAPAIRIQPEEVPLARKMFEAGFRSLVRIMHPDKGGDTRDMQRLNALADSVRAQIDASEIKRKRICVN
jgi:hypothetical protein